MVAEFGRSTPLRRSWKETGRGVLYAATFLIAAVICFLLGWTLFGVVAVAGGVILLLAAGLGGFDGQCPVCASPLARVAKSGLTRCDRCFNYSSAHNRQLTPVGEAYFASFPAFAIPLPRGRGFNLPPICCVCGAPATRRELARFSAVARPGLVMSQVAHLSVDVPYCDQHQAGAELYFPHGERDVAPGEALELKVRSYRFYKTFLELNRGQAAGS